MKQITQTTRINRSRYTGRAIMEELNTHYGYYATARFLTEEEYNRLNSDCYPSYDGPKHEAEIAYNNSSHICG